MLTVAATQLKLMWRERRLAWLALAIVSLVGASLATSAARLSSQAQERQAVAQEEGRLWDSQGVIDPHEAAHVGRAVPAPVRPLAAFDPGLTEYVGTSVFIEGHAQNPARHKPAERGAAISRFGGFSAAWTLQVIVPLLVILAGFSTMSGEAARARLRQELGAGANAMVLVGGRLLALVIAAGLLAMILIGATLPAIAAPEAGKVDTITLMGLAAGYMLYLLIFCAITIAISGMCASARTALVLLLGFWAVSTVLVPRIAPAIAESLEPTPSAAAFRAVVKDEAAQGVDVHNASDEGVIAFKAELMARFNVTRIEDLPINFRGAAYEYGEQLSTDLYNRHFEQLYDLYQKQEYIKRTFSVMSPTISIQAWSRALTLTDFGAHLNFLRGVEDYRYRLVQTLNREIKNHKPVGEDRNHYADIASITRSVTYTEQQAPTGQLLNTQLPNIVILVLWAAIALILVAVSALRLEQRV
ncbi:DUF3526 domain-containing protein [Microbulbifer elongatus]|uniref:DUF3526 domain-containing protein n=1 Tax=Microbulbifer elongatus TaxID=86173 RepID=A0ABT1P2E2_9GAMM|nr:DUF3526 domain-containing protein [Microbulbifer elongatus]MCQ3830274.1 DUF3526 domain-containing protein [Microbulbifer elongatus]